MRLRHRTPRTPRRDFTHLEHHRQKLLDERHVRACVVGDGQRVKHTAACKGHGQQQLIRQMHADGCRRGQIASQALRRAGGDGFGGLAHLRDAGADLANVLILNAKHDGIAWADALWRRPKVDLMNRPLQDGCRSRNLTIHDVAIEMRMSHQPKASSRTSTLRQLQLLPLLHRPNLCAQHPAASLHEARTLQIHFCGNSHALNHGQEALFDELEGRSHRVVRAAFDAQRAGGLGMQQRGQKRLQNKRGAAAGADGEAVVARSDLAGCENEFGGAHFGSFDLRATNLRRGLHAGEVLTHQPGLRSLPTNVRHAKRPPRDQCQRQRRPQQLPAAGFAGDEEEGGVGFAHCERNRVQIGSGHVSRTCQH